VNGEGELGVLLMRVVRVIIMKMMEFLSLRKENYGQKNKNQKIIKGGIRGSLKVH